MSGGQHYGYGTTKIPSQQIFYKNVLMDLKESLRNPYVENLNFEKIIDKYDREHTFFFIDPPYFETTGYQIVETGEKLNTKQALQNIIVEKLK